MKKARVLAATMAAVLFIGCEVTNAAVSMINIPINPTQKSTLILNNFNVFLPKRMGDFRLSMCQHSSSEQDLKFAQDIDSYGCGTSNQSSNVFTLDTTPGMQPRTVITVRSRPKTSTQDSVYFDVYGKLYQDIVSGKAPLSDINSNLNSQIQFDSGYSFTLKHFKFNEGGVDLSDAIAPHLVKDYRGNVLGIGYFVQNGQEAYVGPVNTYRLIRFSPDNSAVIHINIDISSFQGATRTGKWADDTYLSTHMEEWVNTYLTRNLKFKETAFDAQSIIKKSYGLWEKNY